MESCLDHFGPYNMGCIANDMACRHNDKIASLRKEWLYWKGYAGSLFLHCGLNFLRIQSSSNRIDVLPHDRIAKGLVFQIIGRLDDLYQYFLLDSALLLQVIFAEYSFKL